MVSYKDMKCQWRYVFAVVVALLVYLYIISTEWYQTTSEGTDDSRRKSNSPTGTFLLSSSETPLKTVRTLAGYWILPCSCQSVADLQEKFNGLKKKGSDTHTHG